MPVDGSYLKRDSGGAHQLTGLTRQRRRQKSASRGCPLQNSFLVHSRGWGFLGFLHPYPWFVGSLFRLIKNNKIRGITGAPVIRNWSNPFDQSRGLLEMVWRIWQDRWKSNKLLERKHEQKVEETSQLEFPLWLRWSFIQESQTRSRFTPMRALHGKTEREKSNPKKKKESQTGAFFKQNERRREKSHWDELTCEARKPKGIV